LPCRSKKEAELLSLMLNSKPAQDFFEGYIFWDAKRPITVDLLSSISIEKLAQHLGLHSEYKRLFKEITLINSIPTNDNQTQPSLL
jgi:AraC-like DNA-binding protein